MSDREDYSKAYETFVGDGKNIVGIVAYSLYKKEKRKQLLELKKTKQKPTVADKKKIEDFCLAREETYLQEANYTLDKLLNGMITRDKERIFKTYFSEDYDNNKLLNTIKDYTKPKSLLSELKIEVLGNIVWGVLLIVASVFIYFNNDDIRTLKKIFITKLQEDERGINQDSVMNSSNHKLEQKK